MPGHKVGRPARVEQWRQRHRQRLARATADVDRIAAAADHLRLALKCSSPEQRKRIADRVCAELTSTADELLATYEKGRTSRK